MPSRHIIITAYATFVPRGGLGKGALGIIRKPFQNEQVLAVVATASETP